MLPRRETKDLSPWATNMSAKLLQVAHKSQSPPGRHPSLGASPKNLTLGIPPTLAQHLLPHRESLRTQRLGVGMGEGVWKGHKLGK